MKIKTMVWTETLPNQEGWYWIQMGGGECVTAVVMVGVKLHAYVPPWGFIDIETLKNAMWSDRPIALPEEHETQDTNGR
jgi:hypothetical protein